jgi:superfamily I DNA/RNA helicase
MHNPVPATPTLIGRSDPRLTSLSSSEPCTRFAPLCTRPVELVIMSVTDELGRPLVGVFVPDGELRLRLADLLGEQVARGVTAATFHSICARMLREHAGVFGRTESYTVYDQTDVRRVIEWLLSDQQRGQIQQALADHGQPAAAEVLAEISLAKNRLLSPDSYEQAARHTASPLIAAVWRELDVELQRSNSLDFDDLLVLAVRLLAEHPHRLTVYRQRWRWLLVDEYQDTNEAQSVLVALLAGAGGNVCCVGDDDQCLLQGTEVTMADGKRKPIESVKPGDLVMSAHGGGRRGPSRVSSVRTHRRAEGVTIRTAAGREIVSTPEHIHFAGYRLGLKPQLHIVYLMHRQGRGFRIGTTRVYTNGQVKAVIGLQQRCLHEHADAAWVVSTHDSPQEAKIAEIALSLRYGLPTIPFVSRRSPRTTGEGLIDDQLAIDHVFGMLDTESAGARLLADQGLSHAHPHQISQSAEGRRRILTVTLCGGKNGHRLDLTGHDPRVAEDLTRAGYRPTFPKRASPQHWRVSLHRADLGQLLAHAQRLGDLTHARIRLLANVGAANPSAVNVLLPLMPASAVRPGMVLATEDGDYDTVVSVAGVVLDRPVLFDLDVERTHNFVANGIVTHNCIYSWRGAQGRNILAFGERFPGHERIVLGRNFRCRSEILDAAVACVAHNTQREAKALIAMRGAGGEVRVVAYCSDRHEADSVAAAIAQALAGGIPGGEVLVLARTGYATGPLQAALARAGIPHRVLGSLGLYERSEVRDALAYLALLANPADAQAFKRAVGAPKRGVGAATANRVVQVARERHHGDLIAASAHANAIESIRPLAVRDRLRRFGEGLDRARRELRDGRSIGHVVVSAVMLDGGLVRHHQKRRDSSPNPEERQDAERVLEDLRSLCRAAQAYEHQHADAATLTGFLEQAAGLHAHELAAGEPDRRITVSTVHRAKGTEAQLVVLLACEERLLPSWRALAQADGEQLAEARRLFYVACTRAKDQLILTHAATRGGRPTGGPSRFLTEAGLIDPSQALAA